MKITGEGADLLGRYLQAEIDKGKSYVWEMGPQEEQEKEKMPPETGVDPFKLLSLSQFNQAICECQKCPLGKTRTRFVFGEGNKNARLVFVGEAPGAEEDKQGRPFVGAAGKLLTKIIEAMGTKREDVFICNTIKCRPPDNRPPQPAEIEQCEPYLFHQIKLIAPKVICPLGSHAAQTILKTKDPIGKLRNNVYSYQGIPVVPTYHPAACLYDPKNKTAVWQDMQKIMKMLKNE